MAGTTCCFDERENGLSEYGEGPYGSFVEGAAQRSAGVKPIVESVEPEPAQQLEAEARGTVLSGYVFTAPDGGPLCPEYLTRTFNKLVADAGLPPVRLHDLRHGAATLMLLVGADLKTIADQLGHSSIVLTADTYLSVTVELGLAVAVATAQLVLRHAKRPPGGGTTRRRSAPPRAVVTVRVPRLSFRSASPG